MRIRTNATIREGDKVTIEHYFDACGDPDVESLNLDQESGGSVSNTIQRRKLTDTFISLFAGASGGGTFENMSSIAMSNISSPTPTSSFTSQNSSSSFTDKYFGRLTDANAGASGWARIKEVCPRDATVRACPADTSYRCNPLEFAAWSGRVQSWTDGIRAVTALRFPRRVLDIPPPSFLQEGVAVAKWITADAMEAPPYKYPAPVSVSTSLVEESFGQSLLDANHQGVSLTPPDLLQRALDAAGCNLMGGICTDSQWIAAMVAGHNVLKNAASLIRNTGGCTADVYGKGWITHSPNANSTKELCKFYEKFIDPVDAEQLNKKFRDAKKIADVVDSLRPSCFNDGSALGSAYHIFAFGLIAFYSGGYATPAAAVAESIAQAMAGNNDIVYYQLNAMAANGITLGAQEQL